MASTTISLTEIPSILRLYRTGGLATTSSRPPVAQPSPAFNSVVSLIQADITKLDVDAIVNAANKRLLGGGGVDGAIHRAAGRDLRRECETLGGCNTGDAKITGGYRLPCRKIIHTVGPIYWDEKDPDSLLSSCYTRSLSVAAENQLKSIAFSSISTGVYGFPSKGAAEVALKAVRKFLENSSWQFSRVLFCTFENKDQAAYEEMIPVYLPPTADLSGSQSFSEAVEKEAPEGEYTNSAEASEAAHSTVSHSQFSRKQKADAEEYTSEDDWEKVEKDDGTSDDEPVELSQASTVADVQSVVSSTNDLSHSGSEEQPKKA